MEESPSTNCVCATRELHLMPKIVIVNTSHLKKRIRSFSKFFSASE